MYDIIILGKGPAGIQASLYAARAKMKTLVIAKDWGSLEKAEKIENYYGVKSISGIDLLKSGVKQAEALGVEVIEDEVVGISGYDQVEVNCLIGKYEAHALIIAIGSARKKVHIEGLTQFEGRGISYCAVCDGFFYKNKKLVVLGYKDYTAHEAYELKPFTEDITILTNGNPLSLSEETKNLISGMTVIEDKVVEIFGDEKVRGARFENGKTISFDGAFVAYDSASGSELAMKMGLELDNQNIVVDEHFGTNIPNVFAAGDCLGGFKQVSKSVGEGAIAGKSAIEYVREKKKTL
ncbi:MAG: NAD(P)/FAD-dependent oxidoreductase [Clostridia bacterium]|nr:NAD(P)/FAD-dependent oxidoreductase [Clostridia bacterium]